MNSSKSRSTIRVVGTLTNVSPFHLAHANVTGEMTSGDGLPRLATGKVKVPCTMTFKVPFNVAQMDVAGTPTEAGRRWQTALVPTIPGTALRGGIHRAAINLIKDRWIEKKMCLTREQYHVLQVLSYGANKLDRDGLTPELVSRSREDLVAGVFGGGPMMLPSALTTPDAYAITPESLFVGAIPEKAIGPGPYANAYRLTYAHPRNRPDELLNLSDDRAEHLIKNFPQTHGEWVRQVLSNNEARKDEGAEKEKKSSIASQSAAESVIPGTDFGFSLTVTGSDAQIGLVLAGIAGLLQAGIGGRKSIGNGRFKADLKAYLDGSDDELSFISYPGDGSAPKIASDCSHFIAALESAVSDYTVDQFTASYFPPEKDEPKRPGRKGSKAAAETVEGG